jgi:hypothetical protein
MEAWRVTTEGRGQRERVCTVSGDGISSTSETIR